MARYGVLTNEVETHAAIAAVAFCHRVDGSSMKEPVVAVDSLSWRRTAWLEIGGRLSRVGGSLARIRSDQRAARHHAHGSPPDRRHRRAASWAAGPAASPHRHR